VREGVTLIGKCLVYGDGKNRALPKLAMGFNDLEALIIIIITITIITFTFVISIACDVLFP